jgi:hypothetical protein
MILLTFNKGKERWQLKQIYNDRPERVPPPFFKSSDALDSVHLGTQTIAPETQTFSHSPLSRQFFQLDAI